MNYLFLLVSIFSQALFLVNLQSSSINLKDDGKKIVLQEKKIEFIERIKNDFEILLTDAAEAREERPAYHDQEEHEYIEAYLVNHMLQKIKKPWKSFTESDGFYMHRLLYYDLVNPLTPDCENKVFWEYCVKNLNIRWIENFFTFKKFFKIRYFDKNVIVTEEIIEKFCENFNSITERQGSLGVFIAILSNSLQWVQPLTYIKNIDNLLIKNEDGSVIGFFKADLLKILYEKNILEDPTKKKKSNDDHEIIEINDLIAKVDEKDADINKENNNHDTIDNNFNETKDDSKKTKQSFLEKLKQKQRIIMGSFFVFALVCYFLIKNPTFLSKKLS